MHLYPEGKILSGAESLLVLWAKLPKWRILSIILSWPILKQLWQIAYEFLAILLYLKNRSKI